MYPLLSLLIVAAPQGGQGASGPARPNYVELLMRSVGNRDASKLAGVFSSIEHDVDGKVSSLSGDGAVSMLAGCRVAREKAVDSAYVLTFECLERRKVATGCNSGDLTVITGGPGPKPVLFLGEDRKVGPSCPVFVPSPPSDAGGE